MMMNAKDNQKSTNAKKSNQADKPSITTLKIICNDTISRIKWVPRYRKLDDFLQIAKETYYGKDADYENLPPLIITYVDDEEDTVRISSRNELIEAIQNTILQEAKVMRITVKQLAADDADDLQETSSDSDSSVSDFPAQEETLKESCISATDIKTDDKSHWKDRHGPRKIFSAFADTVKHVKQSLRSFKKDTKNIKSAKKLKKSIKRHTKNLQKSIGAKWQKIKDDVSAMRKHCGRGWRHRQWAKWRNRHENQCPSDECQDPSVSNSVTSDEEPQPIHCIQLLSLNSKKRFGPNPKFGETNKKGVAFDVPAVHAKRGKGSWGKLVLEAPCEVLLQSALAKASEEETFVLKSLTTKKYLSMQFQTENQSIDLRFDGDGKTEECLFKFDVMMEPSLRSSCEEQDSLIVSLVSVKCGHIIHCDEKGNIVPLQARDQKSKGLSPFFEKIHCIHNPHKSKHKKERKNKVQHSKNDWRKQHVEHRNFHPRHFHDRRHFHGPHHFRHFEERYGPMRQGNQPRIQITEIDISDKVVRPGEAVEKTWTFRNTCAEAWSPDFGLTHVRGPNLSVNASNIITIGETVLPGQTVSITMKSIAPPLPGRYCSYWRMTDASGCYFGPRVWSSITVGQPSQQ